MWKIKQIFDGDYGCEELADNGLDEGSVWPEDTDE